MRATLSARCAVATQLAHSMTGCPSRFGQLRAMCPEFYDTMPRHSSWTKVIWQYIVDPSVGPFSRIKRTTLSDEARARVRAS